ncbi:helix-turn-helix domain-containing protein [Sunxiuqinia elliptica]
MESIKDVVKSRAREKNIKMLEVSESLGLTQQGMYKAFRDKTIKLNQLERIADVLEIHITDLLPAKSVSTNIAGERIENYGTRIDNNKFFSGSQNELFKLRSENEKFKATVAQQKELIERLDKEVEFLRAQLSK